jgi:hypothetical protein
MLAVGLCAGASAAPQGETAQDAGVDHETSSVPAGHAPMIAARAQHAGPVTAIAIPDRTRHRGEVIAVGLADRADAKPFCIAAIGPCDASEHVGVVDEILTKGGRR